MRKSVLSIVAVSAVLFAVSTGAQDTMAQARTETLKIGPGAQVTIKGSTVIMEGPKTGPGDHLGTYLCTCAIQAGVAHGSCSITETATSVTCFKGSGDTCGTVCALAKQSSPARTGAAARPNAGGRGVAAQD